jgi:hypothetical protein
MLSHLPLDDQLNYLFYIDEGVWRLVWAPALGRCVYRREAPEIDFGHAVTLIASGELLWAPPEDFDRLVAETSLEAVQREHTLLSAFLRSPAGHRITQWRARRRLELRLNDARAWLARRTITRDDAVETGDENAG